MGLVRNGMECEPVYLRNRAVAAEAIERLVLDERAKGRRLLIGFDFPFGYPAGFARFVTGNDDPLAIWDFYAQHLVDSPLSNNRFDLAGELNGRFPGVGPFWFNGTRQDIPNLPRKERSRTLDHGMKERRRAESRAKGTFTCWQMGGAGAVGGQAMTGMASLARLRRGVGDIGVWPFTDLSAPVAFVEIWPSLIAEVVAEAGDSIKDRAQVRLLARALSHLSESHLQAMLDVDAPEEGWILGLGHEQELRIAACRN